MKLQVLGSSSSGNGYIFTDMRGRSLIVEAGVPLIEVKRALHFDISGIMGCIISHQHGDHARYVNQYLECGIKVLALHDVFEHWKIKNYAFCKNIKPQHGYIVGDWRIVALQVVHDVPCVGYLIEHKETGKILFITDTMMLEYKIPGISHYMLECNYADDILQQNIDNGSVIPSMRERLLMSHMELSTTKQIIAANDTSRLESVILIHLSNTNSDKARFAHEVERVSGVPTYIASAGQEFQLENNRIN